MGHIIEIGSGRSSRCIKCLSAHLRPKTLMLLYAEHAYIRILSAFSHEVAPQIVFKHLFVLKTHGREIFSHVETIGQVHRCPGCSQQVGVSCSFAQVNSPIWYLYTAALFEIGRPVRVGIRGRHPRFSYVAEQVDGHHLLPWSYPIMMAHKTSTRSESIFEAISNGNLLYRMHDWLLLTRPIEGNREDTPGRSLSGPM